MEFIEDHRSDPHQFGIPLQAPEKQASCHHFQPGGFGGAMVEAHAVAHLAPRAFVEGLRQSLGRGPGRQSTGLNQQDSIWLRQPLK